MSGLVPYLPVVWVAVAMAALAALGAPRRAILFSVLAGTLFLPEAIPSHVAFGPFHFTKYHAVSYSALLVALLVDGGRVFSFRPQLVDVPMLVWCLCPLPSVLTNEPPPDGSSAIRDALAQTWTQIVEYGIPYLLGRVYLSDRDGVRDLALAVVLAAVVYAPLCLFEVRMSPKLHNAVFGYTQHTFGQTLRYGGYRPMVFFPHGLALAMFVVSAALIAGWLWLAWGTGPDGEPDAAASRARLGYAALLLAATAVLLKSTGALALGVVGWCVLWLARNTDSRGWFLLLAEQETFPRRLLVYPSGPRLGLLLLAAVPLGYVTVRATGLWSGEELVRAVAENIDPDRAASLEFRLTNEDLLIRRALEQPAFGWGGWGRNRVFDEKSGRDRTVTDGLWIIALGDRGLVGLCALGAAFLLPVIRFAATVRGWSTPAVAPATACAVVLALWSIDSLLNAMVLPLYPLIAGGLAGVPSYDFSPDEPTE